jgi:hypothetical protein
MPIRTLTLLRRSQSLPPLSNPYPLSTAYGLTGTKAQRYRDIQRIISRAFVELNPLPDGLILPRRFDGHNLTRPKMNTGATCIWHGGTWYQRAGDIYYFEEQCLNSDSVL